MTRKTRPSAWAGGFATRLFMHPACTWLVLGKRATLSLIRIGNAGVVTGVPVRAAPTGKSEQTGEVREVICRVTKSQLSASIQSARRTASIRNAGRYYDRGA